MNCVSYTRATNCLPEKENSLRHSTVQITIPIIYQIRKPADRKVGSYEERIQKIPRDGDDTCDDPAVWGQRVIFHSIR